MDNWFYVVQVQTHLEKTEPPAPLWLAWQAPATMLAGIHVDATTIWQAYQHRWPIEPSISFRKQRLWCRRLPQFQLLEAADHCLSWTDSPGEHLGKLGDVDALSGKADRSISAPALAATATRSYAGQGKEWHWKRFFAPGWINPASSPKPRGIPPGWPKGKERKRRERFPVVKKGCR